ncbi:MAG: FkbM family methyltransferase [Bacteroidota bacterium]
MLTKITNAALPYLPSTALRALLRFKRWRKPPPFPSINHCLLQYSQLVADVFVIQAGAGKAQVHDPVFQYLSLNEWRGLFIEPQANSFQQLQQSYRRFQGLILENLALSDQAGKQTFYSIKKAAGLPDWTDKLSSFRQDIPAFVQNQYPHAELVATTISCTTLAQMIEKHRIQKLNLLVLDVEGYEAIILKGYDFEPAPDLLLFEHCHLKEVEWKQLNTNLADKGYLLFTEGFNTLAIGQKAPSTIRENYARFCSNNQK